MEKMRRIPDWLRCSLPSGEQYARIKKIVREQNLHTVCVEAKCPNIGECFCSGTATFMILGNVCTRDCRYCAVPKGNPLPVDADEPQRVANAVMAMHISHAVITSVTRDDLPDGGASMFAQALECIRAQNPSTKVELLVPDFLRSGYGALDAVLDAEPDVFNHNIEVVRPLFPILRPRGDYAYSLYVLAQAAKRGL
jgi:lipoic acid synthetase